MKQNKSTSMKKNCSTIDMDPRYMILEKNHCFRTREFQNMNFFFLPNEIKMDFTFIKQILKIGLDERRLHSKEQTKPNPNDTD